ncbi:hypothetical protein B0H15DRAFT_451504 [Mycena belliarum]|uniref:F-box domain-containing protein n=1 Tax=Mycena belliarum TaxID=1033014 RepID=A0AAD6U067_9AGAR|nr:hypothetical protein B0H15DRAFT_451504 [Mycena belliae]
MQERIELQHALLILKLPVDLLGEIFLLTLTIQDLDSTDPFDLSESSSHIDDALRVSHVCSRWRQVAIGMPRLWTGPLVVEMPCVWAQEASVAGLQSWLSRSAPLIIPISLTIPPWTSPSPVLKEVLSTFHRWRTFQLRGAADDFLQSLATRALGRLEQLDVKDSVPLRPCSIEISFVDVPRLRKAKLIPFAMGLTDIRMAHKSQTACLQDALRTLSLQLYKPRIAAGRQPGRQPNRQLASSTNALP